MFPLPTDNKGSGSTSANILPPGKLNSFEVALAKKRALDASAMGVPSMVESPDVPSVKLHSIASSKDDLVKPVVPMAKSLASSPKKELLLDDINGHRVLCVLIIRLCHVIDLSIRVLDTCEVSSVDCQDLMLKDDYADLPKLRCVDVIVEDVL